jgi:hypothetical protein
LAVRLPGERSLVSVRADGSILHLRSLAGIAGLPCSAGRSC